MADSAYAKKLLGRLVELDYQTVEAYYDMGSIISSMQHGKIYDVLGYDSMTHLVDEELTYTPSTAFKYASMFRHFRRLHYFKPEALTILKKFGITHMCEVLPRMKDKIGVRAIKSRIDSIDQNQINFTLTNKELDECHQALTKMGATRSDGGRYMDSSVAFMGMIDIVNTKPHLKAVG